MAKTYSKDTSVQFNDDGLGVRFQKVPGSIELQVDVPDEPGGWSDWTDVYSASERTQLANLLKKAVAHRLGELGYTEV